MTDQITSLEETANHLTRFSQKLATNEQFMASVLSRYCEQERLEELALADRLGITSTMYSRLAICKRPSTDRLDFANHVRQIAAYVGGDAAQIAQIINQVDALVAIDPVPETEVPAESRLRPTVEGYGWLAAARDRIDVADDPSESKGTPAGPDELESEQSP